MGASLISSNQAKVQADPLREALAAAQQEAREAHRAVERQRLAIDKTRAAQREAEKAVSAAEEGIGAAREAHARALADAAAADTAPPLSSMRAARQAVTDAQDQAEALKAALAELKARLPDWERTARDADVEVERCISAILAPHAQKLFDRALALERDLAPIRQALATLLQDRHKTSADVLGHERSRAPLGEVYAGIMRFGAWRAGGPDRFAEARGQLREDWAAVLPDFAAPPPSELK